MAPGRPDFRRAAKARASAAFFLAGAVAGTGLYFGNLAYVRPHDALKVTEIAVAAPAPLKNCAGTIDVVGTIVTNGKGGPITFQWTVNGSAQPAATVTDRTGQDTVQVTLRWTFTGKGTLQAVAELDVLTPNPVVGSAQFTYSCAS